MSHRIQLPRTGESFEALIGETVLQAAQRAGAALAHDCGAGGCGTCRVRLIEGAVTYDEFPFALTEEEASAGYALACQARPTTDLVIEASRAVELLPDPERHTAVIRSVRAIAPRVAHLTLEVEAVGALAYRPGQYANVVLDDGETRSFSMASAPRERLIDFYIRRQEGGFFTERMLAAARKGDMLEVEIPRGSFVHHKEDDRPLLMVATGTGIAPIKAMLEGLMDDPDCPPVNLYWGARTVADLYLHDAIPTWGQRLYGFNYVPVLSRGTTPLCRSGYVQDAVAADFDDLSEHAIYLCGSPMMIASALQTFLDRGAVRERIYTEGFTVQTRTNPA
ncbi:CDP-4-dehydro-6-deoxyglucose reductase [Bradyrhizobium sp. cir1]|uniref:2Fe-2S iron-sulfur cluster-binding protein n=1 Tax=Bradyrhizobium sp. cir1 TaxID=1445730 RepID=UPI0016064099|nr:2Fe-2S iron-sulfur cluster-binding protein [Bradyrhizobium sp. cir1]MBB4369187.1 CDP-4-dehydro-6-deoxyglucose reductase [Bradyrhizobium sp. cir1]